MNTMRAMIVKELIGRHPFAAYHQTNQQVKDELDSPGDAKIVAGNPEISPWSAWAVMYHGMSTSLAGVFSKNSTRLEEMMMTSTDWIGQAQVVLSTEF